MANRGKFIVIDGIDGVGKGVFLGALVEEAKKDGKMVFDVHDFWKGHNFHPAPKELIGKYDLLVTSEPTFIGIGKYIREELIAKNERNYSPEAVAEAYALDRRILYQQLLIPCLKAGIDVYQSRSFASSIVYQRQSALDEGRKFSMKQILKIPGNAFCYQERPIDILVIPTIKDVKEAVRRAEAREKHDQCKFENLEFQLKLKKVYESRNFQRLIRKMGTEIVYLDAGVSEEYSKEQARRFYLKKLR